MNKLEERRNKIQEINNIKKANREKVSKDFRFESGVEEAAFKAIQEYNSIQFTIFRKTVSQTKGKTISYGLTKEEVKELRNYLNEMLENWGEYNKLDK